MARTGMVFSSPRNILAPPSQIDAEAAPVEESDENNEAEDIDSNWNFFLKYFHKNWLVWLDKNKFQF